MLSGCWPEGGISAASRDNAEVLGQLYPSPYATPKTAAPNTWPTGSKPTLRIAANSPEVSEDPQVPLAWILAIWAAAAAGSSSPTTQVLPEETTGVRTPRSHRITVTYVTRK